MAYSYDYISYAISKEVNEPVLESMQTCSNGEFLHTPNPTEPMKAAFDTPCTAQAREGSSGLSCRAALRKCDRKSWR